MFYSANDLNDLIKKSGKIVSIYLINDGYLNQTELLDYLKIGNKKLQKYINNQDLVPYILDERTYRYRISEVHEFMEKVGKLNEL